MLPNPTVLPNCGNFLGENSSDGVDYWLSSTDQILISRNRALLEHEKIRSAAQPIDPRPGFPVWTDDFNNLLTVLKR